MNLPETLNLTGTLELQAAAAGETKRPSFRMQAYSGDTMRVGGFFYPVVLDLDGVKAAENITILLEHDPERILGMADNVKINKSGIRISGFFTNREDENVQKVLAHAQGGFVWQGSVGAAVSKNEIIGEGKTVRVNGKSFEGPLNVVRAATIREISFVGIAADATTHAEIAAGLKGKKMSEQNILEQERQAEAARVRGIAQICGGDLELQARAIEENWPVEKCELEVLRAKDNTQKVDALRASRPTGTFINRGGNDVNENDALTAAVLLTAGYKADKFYQAPVLNRAADLHLRSLLDLASVCLQREGRQVPGNTQALVKAAFSTTSLPTILSGVVDKILLDSFASTPQSWRSFSRIKPISNFRDHSVLRLNLDSALDEIGNAGEVKHGVIGEDSFNNLRIGTYAKLYRIGHKTIADDDMGALVDVPAALARSAARKLNDLIYEVILANAGNFFHTNNSNYLSGAGSSLSVDALDDALVAMRQQVDENGAAIDIQPKVLVVPPELESLARVILNSTTLARDTATADNLPEGNPLAGRLALEVETRLSNATFAGNSALAWYLFAGPQDSPLIVGFLGGNESPTLESFTPEMTPDYLGFSWRIVHNFGASLADPRACVKSAGA